MNRKLLFCGLLLAVCPLPAWSADEVLSPRDAYLAVMRAQYAARQAPLPIRGDEASRIHDAYLRSIGQAAKENTRQSGNGAGTTSR